MFPSRTTETQGGSDFAHGPGVSGRTLPAALAGSSLNSFCCLRRSLSHFLTLRLPSKNLIMLTGDMKLWHGLVIAAVSLFLQACLLAAISYRLSRHVANQSEQILKATRLQAPGPSPASHHPSASKELKETGAERRTPVCDCRYRNDSDTSSDSSDSSDNSPSTHQTSKDVNYTQVVFLAPGELKNESALDYENLKEATDYVNVNPKSRKPNLWTFVNPAASEPVEYTQVTM
ncbi:regulator of hemoglobinization and erythroid cell expansion protein [Tamandua tetradactyla]|uniref:regulator of hemoglobinization and erythroid cell expansion protein n=1 Tax=Tamandua tetradactyla TaxID=48850 RepID=UPI004053AF22